MNQIMNPTTSRIPTVIEEEGGKKTAWDVFSLLGNKRIVFLDEQFHDGMASVLCAHLLYLESEDPNKVIDIYINSPGGSVSSGLAIYDVMHFISCPIRTTVMGLAASMGSFILMAGSPGLRYAMPHAKVMTHQPSAGAQGTITDMEITLEAAKETKRILTSRYLHHCGGDLEKWEAMLERDVWHSAEQAKKWGMIDKIVEPKKKAEYAA